jgi:hypothetical protein
VGSTLAYVSGKSANAAALSAKVFALSEGVLRMLWLNKMKMAAGVVLASVLAGAGVGLVVRQTWAGGGEQVAQPAAGGHKAKPQVVSQEGTQAEIAELRKEMTKLRGQLDAALKTIKRLDGLLAPVTAPIDGEQVFRGKPLAFWLNQRRDGDPKTRGEAVEALAYFARKNKKLIPLLISDLNPDWDPMNVVRVNALNALPFVGDEVVPALTEVLKDTSSPARRDAISILRTMGPRAKASVPVLAQLITKKDETLREAAFHALEQIGPDAKPAIPALVNYLGDSITAFKSSGEKQQWWKTNRLVGGPLSTNNLPSLILRALISIDPAIETLLPRDWEMITTGEGLAWQAVVSEWQKAYEALKSQYGKK